MITPSAYMQRERAENVLLVPGEMAFLKPFTVSSRTTQSSRWFQSIIVLRKNEFLSNSDLHCTVIKHLLLLVTCLYMILQLSQSDSLNVVSPKFLPCNILCKLSHYITKFT